MHTAEPCMPVRLRYASPVLGLWIVLGVVVLVVAEASPGVTASANFLAVQEELTGAESKIAYGRQYYTEQVRLLNTRIQCFPSSVIATLFHVERREVFDVEDAGRGPVRVDL